ncbi:hypothetical protein A2U01_0117308, partial [Trifolium medium]|nr:hypothetical protein [Trifolium medium]
MVPSYLSFPLYWCVLP